MSENYEDLLMHLINNTQPQQQAPEFSIDMTPFRTHLRVMLGVRESTMEVMSRMIKKMLTELKTIIPTHKQITEYVLLQYSLEKKSEYIRNQCTAIEKYMSFIKNPIHLGRPKKQKTIIKETLTEAEVAIILHSITDIRKKAIISVLAYSGIRNQELCNLKVENIDFNSNMIMVIDGKHSRDRKICITPECTKVLSDYLNAYRREADEFLFTTKRDAGKFSTTAIRRLVKKIVSKTNIEKRVYPHLMRHSLSVNMLRRGANILAIKDQLGHQFIETTMIYVNSRNNYLASEYAKFSPGYM